MSTCLKNKKIKTRRRKGKKSYMVGCLESKICLICEYMFERFYTFYMDLDKCMYISLYVYKMLKDFQKMIIVS